MTYRSILCLNGELPSKEFFSDFKLPLIAADGAADKLHSLEITPQVIVGDLDSVKHKYAHSDILHIEDQNRCDYEKAMHYLETQGLLPTIVVGFSGGDLDHILNNISVFMSFPHGHLLYAPPLYGSILSQTSCFDLPQNTKVSIFGLPYARLITQGLEWDLTGQPLSFPGFNSALNRIKSQTITLQVLEGKALFLAHAFFTQT